MVSLPWLLVEKNAKAPSGVMMDTNAALGEGGEEEERAAWILGFCLSWPTYVYGEKKKFWEGKLSILTDQREWDCGFVALVLFISFSKLGLERDQIYSLIKQQLNYKASVLVNY